MDFSFEICNDSSSNSNSNAHNASIMGDRINVVVAASAVIVAAAVVAVAFVAWQ